MREGWLAAFAPKLWADWSLLSVRWELGDAGGWSPKPMTMPTPVAVAAVAVPIPGLAPAVVVPARRSTPPSMADGSSDEGAAAGRGSLAELVILMDWPPE